MIDEESPDTPSEPAAGAPVNRDRRPNDAVIEGEVLRQEPEKPAVEVAPERVEAGEAAPPPRDERPRSGRALAAGAVAGAVAAAIVATAFALGSAKGGLSEADSNRFSALETAAGREDAAIAALDKRVAALEGAHSAAATAALGKRLGMLEASAGQSGDQGLDKRLGALEAASASDGEKIATGADAIQRVSSDVQALQAAVKSASSEIPDLAARVGKLEASNASGDLAALTDKVGKIESALAAPKPEAPKPSDNAAALALVAQTISDKLATGAPFANDIAALGALGADPANLEPLKGLANGSPTDHALAVTFEALEPKMLASFGSGASGGVGDRFLASLRGLVQIRRVGETQGDDPQALASQVVARLERGDLDGALAAFAKLPDPARQAASAGAAEAGAKQAAVAAAQALRDSAVGRFTQNSKP